MVDFHGLTLRNCIIAASSPATESTASVAACVAAGCGAVILKSVAPDRMRAAASWTPRRMFWQHETLYMLSSLRREFMTLDQGTELLKDCHREIRVPLIASSTGSLQHPEEWMATLKRLADAGADMLQMDSFYALPNACIDSVTIARDLVAFARECQNITSRPVLLKLGPTVPAEVISGAVDGANIGISLLDSICVGIPFDPNTGQPAFRGVEVPGRCRAAGRILYPLALLYTQRLSAVVPGRICAGGGVFSASDASGLLRSGATCVQLASAICVHGYGAIHDIVKGVREDFTSAVGEMKWRHEAPVGTVVRTGRVVKCTQSCREDAPCQRTVMCDRVREADACEGCGLCIDLCSSGLAYFKELPHED